MQAIINKAKKDFSKTNFNININDIFSCIGFIKYFRYRNLLPFVKDIFFYLIEILEIYLIYKFLGKNYFHIGVLGYLFFILINIISRTISYTIREKFQIFLNDDCKHKITNFFSSVLFSSIIFFIFIFIVFLFLISSQDNSIVLINKSIAGLFLLFSSIYFQATYATSRIYFNVYLLIFLRLLAFSVIFLTFKYLHVYSFVIYFYLDTFIQLINTVYYCNRTLKNKRIKLLSKHFKEYTNKMFEIFKYKKLYIRFFSVFLKNGYKFILIILVQVFDFFMNVIKRISRSLFFDIYKLSSKHNILILNKLILNNFIVVVFVSLISVFLFSKLDFFTNFSSKWKSIYMYLMILEKWNGFYLFVFFTSISLFFSNLLEYIENHLFIIIFSFCFIYFLPIILLMQNDYFIQSQNPVMYFYFAGYVNIFYSIFLAIFFIFSFWKKYSFSYNIKNLIPDDIHKLFNKKDDNNKNIVIVTFTKKFNKNYYINFFFSLINKDSIISFSLISNNSYIILLKDFNFSFTKDLLFKNCSFMCDQLIISNNGLKDVNLKYFFKFIYPSFFEYIDINYYMNKYENIVFNFDYLNTKTPILLLQYFVRNLIPEHLVFKKDYKGFVPIYDSDFKYIKTIFVKDLNVLMLKKVYQKIIINYYVWFIKKI